MTSEAADSQAADAHEPYEGPLWVKLLTIAMMVALLCAIVIPLVLDYRAKSRDVTAERELGAVASSLRDWADAGNESAPALEVDGFTVMIGNQAVATVTGGSELGELHWDGPESWCIDIMNPAGDRAASVGYVARADDDDTSEGQCP